MDEKEKDSYFKPSGGEISLRELLKIAIRSEIESAETYRKLLDRDLPAETREKVERLVEQEEEHEEKFWSVFSDFFPDDEKDLGEGNEIEAEIRNSEDPSLQELLETAMKDERKSEEFYDNLRDQFEDREVRSMLGYLAANEREHYQILQQELKKLD